MVMYLPKLGYNDHVYNEFTAITNKFVELFGPNLHYYSDVAVITNKMLVP